MAMTVTLYKDCNIDGITRIGRWETLAAQLTYLNRFEHKTYSDVPTVRLGEPLRLNDKLNNLIEYNYGSIDFGDGFLYFFSVADLSMRTEKMTDISYVLDCWDTIIAQIGNPIRRAIVTRYSQPMGIVTIPYNPMHKIETSYSYIRPASIVGLYWDSKNNNAYTLMAPIDNALQMEYAITGKWFPYDNSEWPATGLLSCGIIPYTFTDMSNWVKIESNYECYYKSTVIDMEIANPFNRSVLMNTGTEFDEIRDLRGNVVFTCPYNEKLTYSRGTIDISASSVQMRYTYYNEDNKPYDVVVPSELPNVFADTWQEYQSRQREIDIENRNLQINQQLYSGIANSATSAVMGALMGPIGGMSAGAGAAMGGGGGLISTLGNYAIQSVYSPKIQAQTDKAYHYANDALSVCGSACYSMYNTWKGGLFHIEWDTESKDTYNYDVQLNGYYTTYVPDDPMESLTDYAGPITADVDLSGSIPIAWKEQIHSRFANGVVFI